MTDTSWPTTIAVDQQSVLIELIKIGPSIFWLLFAGGLIILVGPRRIRSVFSNATRIGFVGVELEFKSELAEMARSKNLVVPENVSARVAERINRLQILFGRCRILWIDDNPIGNFLEIELLRQLGVVVDIAQSDDDARHLLKVGVYDAVLSDIARGGTDTAGVEFVSEVKAAWLSPPIIFYVGSEGNKPDGCFGLTSRPDELFNLIMDLLERKRSL
jgi:CheY-like chemotaxis protein